MSNLACLPAYNVGTPLTALDFFLSLIPQRLLHRTRTDCQSTPHRGDKEEDNAIFYRYLYP